MSHVTDIDASATGSLMRALMLAPVGGYGGFNTSVHRMRALQDLGLHVGMVDSAERTDRTSALQGRRVRAWLFRQGLPLSVPDTGDDVGRLLASAATGDWDLVWLEKALTVGAPAMHALRRACPRAFLVGFSPDDMSARHNQSQQFLESLPHYDAFLTTKSYNVEELRVAGCRRVVFVGNGYDPAAFRPLRVSVEDEQRLGGDVGFIGSFERDRAEAMIHLAENGVQVRVWGNGWERAGATHPNLRVEGLPLAGDDFALACGAFKINLGFLRKLNRDQQTTRSVEIPACGGFMLAERTPEHEDLFIEGAEAEFFSSLEELLRKCRRYLDNPETRQAIASRGRDRCVKGGYSNADRLRSAFASLGLRVPAAAQAEPRRPPVRQVASE